MIENDVVICDNKISVCVCKVNKKEYKNLINTLSFDELNYYKRLKSDRRKKSFLIGRYTAKIAVSNFSNEKNLNNISVVNGVFKQPIAIGNNVEVTISHSGDLAITVAYSRELIIGIDVEKVDYKVCQISKDKIINNEVILVSAIDLPETEKFTMLWTIKESLMKVLKTGLEVSYCILEISKIYKEGPFIYNEFKNFPQYKCVSFSIQNYMFSITYPRKINLRVDLDSIKKSVFK
jgi:phosphopantetheinyl transferase